MQHDHIAALPKGHRLKEYVVERVLGQGAFGITYLALDSNLNTWVAIKEYLPDDLAVRDQYSTVKPKSTASRPSYLWGLERFFSEAQTVARFNHPNIVRVLRLMRENGTAYIVMPYERGRSLADHLLRLGRPLREGEMLALLRPLLDGLAAVHAENVLHRDIKPGNIFLRTDGTPVLLDFGSARQAVRGERRDMTSVLTPGYAPIEQYADSGHQGPWTDIYALGAVLYRSLTGKTPVDATVRSEEALNRRPDPLVPAERFAAETYPGQYSPTLLQAIDRALALVAGERPQSIGEWQQILPATRREPTGGRRTPAALSPPAGAEGLPQPPPLPELPSRPPSQSPPRPAALPRRGRLGPLLAGLLVVAIAGGVGALGPWSPWSPWPTERERGSSRQSAREDGPSDTPAASATEPGNGAPADLPPAAPPDDPQAAVDYWRDRAEAGSAAAARQLGLAYLEGTGVSQDFREAERWFRIAAEAGDAIAQTRLGLMLRDGMGVRPDARRSVDWLRRATEQGHAEAAAELGIAYRDGLGVPVDPQTAARRFLQAAEAGHAGAQAALGQLHASGRGVPPDPDAALGWFRRAAAQGHAGAALALSDLYAQGRGVARDTAEAVRWAAIALAGDDAKTVREAQVQLQALGEGARTQAAYRLLRNAGYDPGPERPWPSVDLRNAVRAFQRNAGRPADGAVTVELLAALAASDRAARGN